MNVLATPVKARGQALLARQASVRQGCCLVVSSIHILDSLLSLIPVPAGIFSFLGPGAMPQFLCFYSPYLAGFSLCSLLYSAAKLEAWFWFFLVKLSQGHATALDTAGP